MLPAEKVGEEVQKFHNPKYSVAQVQIHPEIVLQKAQVLSKPQIKQNKADTVALPPGANLRHSGIAPTPNNMVDARQTLRLQDATKLPKFDADKVKDPKVPF